MILFSTKQGLNLKRTNFGVKPYGKVPHKLAPLKRRLESHTSTMAVYFTLFFLYLFWKNKEQNKSMHWNLENKLVLNVESINLEELAFTLITEYSRPFVKLIGSAWQNRISGLAWFMTRLHIRLIYFSYLLQG